MPLCRLASSKQRPAKTHTPDICPPRASPSQFARVYTPLILLLCLAMAGLPWLLLEGAADCRVSGAAVANWVGGESTGNHTQ